MGPRHVLSLFIERKNSASARISPAGHATLGEAEAAQGVSARTKEVRYRRCVSWLPLKL